MKYLLFILSLFFATPAFSGAVPANAQNQTRSALTPKKNDNNRKISAPKKQSEISSLAAALLICVGIPIVIGTPMLVCGLIYSIKALWIIGIVILAIALFLLILILALMDVLLLADAFGE